MIHVRFLHLIYEFYHMQHEPKTLLRVVVRCVIHPENSAVHKKWGSFKMVTRIKHSLFFQLFNKDSLRCL